MTARVWPSAFCPGCKRQRMVTAAGVFGRHRRGWETCPSSGHPPEDAPTPGTRAPSPDGLMTPPPPGEPADGRSCDGGGCNRPSVGWRLFRGERHWLPVCGLHMDGPASRTRIYDDQTPIRTEEAPDA